MFCVSSWFGSWEILNPSSHMERAYSFEAQGREWRTNQENCLVRLIAHQFDASIFVSAFRSSIRRNRRSIGDAEGGYLEHLLPGGNVLAWTIHLVLDISIVTVLFAMIFKFLPAARPSWRDVRLGAVLTAALFLVGKYALGLYLGSGAADDSAVEVAVGLTHGIKILKSGTGIYILPSTRIRSTRPPITNRLFMSRRNIP